jgi:replication-associated recombination protein RarA
MRRTGSGRWHRISTRHGLAADEVISALQKEIRRGRVENAALLAYELLVTSSRLEDYLWRRLLVISVEDVGLAEPHAALLVAALHRMLDVLPRGAGERTLLAVHAVRYLCRCPKDRSSDEMLHWIASGAESGALRPTIPDYALDMHTVVGRRKGRGATHFWTEGTQLSPELPERDVTYRRWVEGLLARGETSSLEHRPAAGQRTRRATRKR